MKTFLTNRDPVFLVAAIQSVLALLLSFGALGFIGLETTDHLALVTAVLNGLAALYLALATSETLLAPLIEVIKAGIALGAIYGLTITLEQTGLLIAALTAIFAAYQRGQVQPLSSLSLATVVPGEVVSVVTNTVNVPVAPPLVEPTVDPSLGDSDGGQPGKPKGPAPRRWDGDLDRDNPHNP